MFSLKNKMISTWDIKPKKYNYCFEQKKKKKKLLVAFLKFQTDLFGHFFLNWVKIYRELDLARKNQVERVGKI